MARVTMKDFNAQKKALEAKLRAEKERIAREIAEAEAKQLQQLGALVVKAGGDDLAPKELLGAVLDIMERASSVQREAWARLADVAFPEPAKGRARKADQQPQEQQEEPPAGFGQSAAA